MGPDSDAPAEHSSESDVESSPEASSSPPPQPVTDTKSGEKSASRATAYLLAIPALTGIVASAILLVDYLRPLPVYCEEGGGCAALKNTELAWVFFGLPTPFVGLVGFLFLAFLVLLKGRGVRFAFAITTSLAGVFAAMLLRFQVDHHVFCKFCVVADISALTLMVGAAIRAAKQWDPPGSLGKRALAMSGLFVVAAIPLVFGFTRAIPVPDAIRKEMAQTAPGKITVVDFVDYECPFCRRTNIAFEPILAENASRVRVVRRNVPLAMHPHALDAAKAACCGQKLGKGEEMTKALLSTDVDNLTPEGCAAVASSLGLEPEAFSACVQDPSTQASIDADVDEFHAAKGEGLPTIWIDDQGLFGEQTGEMLQDAMNHALKDADSHKS